MALTLPYVALWGAAKAAPRPYCCGAFCLKAKHGSDELPCLSKLHLCCVCHRERRERQIGD